MKFGFFRLGRKSKTAAMPNASTPNSASKPRNPTIGEIIRNPPNGLRVKESVITSKFLESEPAFELSITPDDFSQILPKARSMTGRFNEKGEPDENGEYFFAAMVKFRDGETKLHCKLFFAKR